MRPGADRYTPDDTADRPTSSAGSGFAEAYRVHRPGLVKLAAFIVGDQATGEDVVQDVFTRLGPGKGPGLEHSVEYLELPE